LSHKLTPVRILLEAIETRVFPVLAKHGLHIDPAMEDQNGWSGSLWLNYFYRKMDDYTFAHLTIMVGRKNGLSIGVQYNASRLMTASSDDQLVLRQVREFNWFANRASSPAMTSGHETLIDRKFLLPWPFDYDYTADPERNVEVANELCDRVCRAIDAKLEAGIARVARSPAVVKPRDTT
jgi:hypothetical protein